MDYFSKFYAQTHLNISYESYFINLEKDHERYLTLAIVFVALIFFQSAKDFMPKVQKLTFWAQTFFSAGLIATTLDSYLYPGSLKLLLGANLADIYLVISLILTVYLIWNFCKKTRGNS